MTRSAHIAVLAATLRGVRVLDTLLRDWPEHRYTVVTFSETAAEPRFVEQLRSLAAASGATFHMRSELPQRLATWEPTPPVDVGLAINWRYLVAPAFCDRLRRGLFVIHDSLLPQYRGFSPTIHAIADGREATGCTLFRAAAEVDQGPIVARERVAIGADDYIGTIFERQTDAYVKLVRENLDHLLSGESSLTPQDEHLATAARRLGYEDRRINWASPAKVIRDLVRAWSRPYPGAFTSSRSGLVTIWRARVGSVVGSRLEPGTVAAMPEGEIAVVAGDARLVVLEEVECAGVSTTMMSPSVLGSRLGGSVDDGG